MSNTSPFASEGASPKPTRICIGSLTHLSDVALTDGAARGKEDYYKIPYKLSASDSRDQIGTFLFIPQFFEPTYSPRRDPSKSHKFVYSNNIYRDDDQFNLLASPNINVQRVGLATLPGLCGSEQVFNEIGRKLQEQFCQTTPEEFARVVHDTLTALMLTEDHQIGYVLKQQFQSSGRLNEKGYEEKIPGKYYEIAGFFWPTEKAVEMLEKKVEKFNSSAKTYGYKAEMTFALDTPFASGASSD